MIEVRHLVKRFGPKTVLRNLDFHVEQGEFVALLGPNGAGKTTFLRILASLSRPALGEVRIAGYRLPDQSAAVRRRLGVVSHLPLLYGELTAEENLRFYGRMYAVDGLEQRIAAVLDLVGLAPRRRDLVRTFSRGMQQRLAIGRAVLHEPEVLLLDEPHTGLDQDACQMLELGDATGRRSRPHGGHDLARPDARRRPGFTLRCTLSRRDLRFHPQRAARAGRPAGLLPPGAGEAGVSAPHNEPVSAPVEESLRPGAEAPAASGRRVGAATPFLRAMAAVVWKDLAAELRSRELLSAMLVFALLVILIFNFALELDATARANVTSGVLWVTFVFAGTLGLNRSMAVEKDRGCLDGLLLAPVDRSAIYFGKAIGNLVFMLVMAAIVLPVYSLLYNINALQPGLLLVVLLGSIGYVAVGTLLASMAVQARTRDMLLPILLFPVAIPVLVAAVKASSGYLQGLAMSDIWPWLNLLIVYDVIFVAIAFMVFDYVVEE